MSFLKSAIVLFVLWLLAAGAMNAVNAASSFASDRQMRNDLAASAQTYFLEIQQGEKVPSIVQASISTSDVYVTAVKTGQYRYCFHATSGEKSLYLDTEAGVISETSCKGIS